MDMPYGKTYGEYMCAMDCDLKKLLIDIHGARWECRITDAEVAQRVNAKFVEYTMAIAHLPESDHARAAELLDWRRTATDKQLR
jgi:hypothetical protein